MIHNYIRIVNKNIVKKKYWCRCAWSTNHSGPGETQEDVSILKENTERFLHLFVSMDKKQLLPTDI